MSDSDQVIRNAVKGASVVYVDLFVELLIALVTQAHAAQDFSVMDFGVLGVKSSAT